MTAFLAALAVIGATMMVIKYACDQFEPAAEFLARGMVPGIKGATINAIGSSMPELFTAMAFLFTISRVEVAEGLLASVAVTAGSAVFNAVVIPAAVILAVTSVGLKTESGAPRRVAHVAVARVTVVRDGAFLLVAELMLIHFLGYAALGWWTAATLIAAYAAYLGFLLIQSSLGRTTADAPPDEPERAAAGSRLRMILTLDFVSLLYGGRPFTTRMAWQVLGLSTAALAVACHVLAEAVVSAAEALDVPLYFTAVILAAAATSLPDTVLSVKDARKGNYDDAISNALGSNIFDITICLGVPILLYTAFAGAIDLTDVADLGADVRALGIVLVGVTVAVIGLFLGGRHVGARAAVALLGVYACWVGWIVHAALDTWQW